MYVFFLLISVNTKKYQDLNILQRGLRRDLNTLTSDVDMKRIAIPLTTLFVEETVGIYFLHIADNHILN
jgi:hypothetical protein